MEVATFMAAVLLPKQQLALQTRLANNISNETNRERPDHSYTPKIKGRQELAAWKIEINKIADFPVTAPQQSAQTKTKAKARGGKRRGGRRTS